MTRKDRLFLWWLGNRYPDHLEVDHVALEAACRHLKFPPERVIEILRERPGAWNREMTKRDCRIAGVFYPGENPRKVAAAHGHG